MDLSTFVIPGWWLKKSSILLAMLSSTFRLSPNNLICTSDPAGGPPLSSTTDNFPFWYFEYFSLICCSKSIDDLFCSDRGGKTRVIAERLPPPLVVPKPPLCPPVPKLTVSNFPSGNFSL